MADLERLREMIPIPPPSAEERARSDLRTRIEAERSRGARKRVGAAAVLAAGLIAVVVVAALVVAPPEAEASLERLARAVEELPADRLPEGDYHYTRSTQRVIASTTGDVLPGVDDPVVSFLQTRLREIWVAADGSRVRRITVAEPQFFDPEVATVLGSGETMELFDVGESETASFPPPPGHVAPSDLPTDPSALEARLRAGLRVGETPGPAALLDAAVDLVAETGAPPDLRAAVLRVIGRIDGLEVSPGGEADEYAVEASVEFHQDGRLQRSVVRFDGAGHVLSRTLIDVDGIPEAGVPPGAVIERSDYAPTVIVDEFPGSSKVP